MEIMSYKTQAELLLRNYMLADSRVLYTSIIGGICACKMVYDLSQAFSAFYIKSYSSLSKPQKIEWNNRAISTFHAVFIATLSIYFVFGSDLYSNNQLTSLITLRHSKLSTFALGVSVGYFLSDLAMIIWLYPSLGGLEYVVHHLLSMVSVVYAMLTGEGQLYTFMVLISEMTTPTVNLRWYLDAAGMKKSRSYLINGVAMLLTWLLKNPLVDGLHEVSYLQVARIMLFMYLFYHISAHYDQVMQIRTFGRFLIIVVPAVLAIMNLMWFWKIIKGLQKTLEKRH